MGDLGDSWPLVSQLELWSGIYDWLGSSESEKRSVRSVIEGDGGWGEWSRSFFLGGDDEGRLGLVFELTLPLALQTLSMSKVTCFSNICLSLQILTNLSRLASVLGPLSGDFWILLPGVLHHVVGQVVG